MRRDSLTEVTVQARQRRQGVRDADARGNRAGIAPSIGATNREALRTLSPQGVAVYAFAVLAWAGMVAWAFGR